MRRIISLLMENEPGALSRVVGLFSQRSYNIDSLTVAPTEDNSLSRLTVMTSGDERKIEQITKHLNKLIDVVKLVDLSESAHIERELMLIKVKAVGAQRAEVQRLADIFRGQIVDITATALSIQVTGTSDKLDAFIAAQAENTVLEVARTGVCGISRGDKVLYAIESFFQRKKGPIYSLLRLDGAFLLALRYRRDCFFLVRSRASLRSCSGEDACQLLRLGGYECCR